MTEEAVEPAQEPEKPAAEPAKPSDSLLDAPAFDFSAGKPEGFPDDFWDADSNTPRADELYNAYNQQKARADGLRVKLSKGEFEGKPPEDINEYVLELSDELKPIVPDDDPLFNASRQAAKEAGLPKEVFNKFMTPIITELARLKGESEAPPTEEQLAEQKAQMDANRSAEIAKLGSSGTKIVAAIDEFRKGLLADGTLSTEEAEAMKMMVYDATTARIMNKLRVRRGQVDNVPLDIPVDDASSKADIESKMAKAFAEKNEHEYSKYAAMLSKYA